MTKRECEQLIRFTLSAYYHASQSGHPASADVLCSLATHTCELKRIQQRSLTRRHDPLTRRVKLLAEVKRLGTEIGADVDFVYGIEASPVVLVWHDVAGPVRLVVPCLIGRTK